MEVGCERCGAIYSVDRDQVGEQGTAVRCAECEHTFSVKRSAAGEGVVTEPHDKTWLLEKRSGKVYAFDSLATLQRWIVQRRATREDRIGRRGSGWKNLADIAELEPFFSLLDRIDRVEKLGRERAGADESAKTDVPVLRRTSAPAEATGSAPSDSAATREEAAARRWAGLESLDLEAERGEGALDQGSAKRSWARLWIPLALVSLGLLAWLAHQHRDAEWLFVRFSEQVPSDSAEEALTPAQAGEHVEETGTAADASSSGDDDASRAAAPADASSSGDDDASRAAGPAVAPVVSPATARVSERSSPRAPARTTYQGLMRQATNARERGRFEQALNLYTRAGELQPNRPEPLIGQGYCYLEMRAWGAAVGAFEQAWERAPRNGDAIIGLAEALRLSGDETRARSQYELYLELHPDGPEAPVARTNLRR